MPIEFEGETPAGIVDAIDNGIVLALRDLPSVENLAIKSRGRGWNPKGESSKPETRNGPLSISLDPPDTGCKLTSYSSQK